MTGSHLPPTSTVAARQAVGEAREAVRRNLRAAAAALEGLGVPRPALDGKLLRPLAAYLVVPEAERHRLDARFWMGTLAVEMVHEASLLHDDILDDAPERRGRPTLSASAGIGPALVLGDHLLTSAYRAAAQAGSLPFLELFITSVERTVAGEIAQEKSQGRILTEEEYRGIVTGKSGELFRSVLALPAALLGLGRPEAVGALGARLGCLYQMVDDFLDYCPGADRGKAPLQDYRQKKWTWPLGLIGATDFRASEETVLERLFRPAPGAMESPMEVGVREVEERVAAILAELRVEGMETELLGELLGGWVRQLRGAAREEVALQRSGGALAREGEGGGEPAREGGWLAPHLREELVAAAASLEKEEDWLAYFGKHARSFRFASRLFPPAALRQVAGVYAFCRFTDDLVDEAGSTEPALLEARLATWEGMAREAYEGRATRVPLLDEVMGEARRAGVPFHYVHELLEGVGMDLVPGEYRSLSHLRLYSYRVASVVGGWLTELFGVRDSLVLERAYALGHAMQLTNILRDVGEDLRRGRIYLPQDRMARHGVDRPLLEAMAREGGPVFPGYRALLEELMAEADADYQLAMEAIPALPSFFRKPVAIAARVYQGIHREIRRNGYDNLNRRARTSLPRKVWLGASALFTLARLPTFPAHAARPPAASPRGVGSEQAQEAAA